MSGQTLAATTGDDALRAELQAFIGEPSRVARTAPDPVCTAQIRRWIEAFGDDNPIYLDEAAAVRAGRPGIVAPPAMLGVFTSRGLREMREAAETASGLTQLLAERGFVTPGASLSHIYESDLRPGDIVSEITEVERVSSRKETRRGGGYFITFRADFTNQDGRRIGTQRLTIFAFQPAGVPAPMASGEAPPEVPTLPDAADALLPLSIAIDRLGVIACTTACNDFQATHYDPEAARKRGFEDIFTDIYSGIGFAQRYVSDWAGPSARIAAIDTRLGASFYAGDTLTITGRVTERSAAGTSVAVRGVCRTGLHLDATVRLAAAGA